MAHAVTVQMNGKRQIGRGLVIVHALLEQQRVGTQVDELLARHETPDDFGHFFVD